MATKHTDTCFQRAEDDEELFTLLARDPDAPEVVEFWAALRVRREGSTEKVRGADQVAEDMRKWRHRKRGTP